MGCITKFVGQKFVGQKPSNFDSYSVEFRTSSISFGPPMKPEQGASLTIFEGRKLKLK